MLAIVRNNVRLLRKASACQPCDRCMMLCHGRGGHPGAFRWAREARLYCRHDALHLGTIGEPGYMYSGRSGRAP
jgi:hypothetical protein